MTMLTVEREPLLPRVEGMIRTAARVPLGRLALLLPFAALLLVTRISAWWQITLILAATSLFPQHRRRLVTIAALAWVIVNPPLLGNPLYPGQLNTLLAQRGAAGFLLYWPAIVALVCAFGATYAWLVRRFPSSPIGRRPVTCLILILCALYAAQSYLHGATWFIVAASAMVLCHYIIYFAYAIADRQLQPGFWRPFWYQSKCPIGKGPAYLAKVEARNDEELAICQMKGMKLLYWAAVLSVARVVLSNVVFGPNSESMTRIPGFQPPGFIPTYAMALDAQLRGEAFPWAVRWMALISHFFFNLLDLSIWGHKAVAICRMAGFNIFRVTYKPLSATSVAEFFNRYHWYFKEMLATFFFFPTYLRYFKKRPKARIVFATFAAAGLGNFLFHFLHYDRNIFEFGFFNALVGYHAYAVYAIILSIGISVSQVRALDRKRKPPTGFRKVMAIAGVWLFFCLLSIIGENSVTITIADYFSYFLSLFHP